MKKSLMLIQLLGVFAGIYIIFKGTFLIGLFILIINTLGLIINTLDNGKNKK